MKANSLITWIDKVEDQSFDDRKQTERVMRADHLLHAAKLLDQDEFKVLKLHDIDGCSITKLQELTGLPCEVIEAQIEELRSMFVEHIQAEARRWRERLKALEGDAA